VPKSWPSRQPQPNAHNATSNAKPNADHAGSKSTNEVVWTVTQ